MKMDFTYTKNVLLRLLTELLSDYTAEEIKEEIEFELNKIKTLEQQQQVSVKPVVKPACETLQRRFDIYMDAINQIDDFFEYRYERLNKNQIKEIVMNIIDGITQKLSKSV